ncbi:MAG: hypothetical protein KA988_02720 [Longilinea sp.]|nr:hypothetical protein [Longilinea sp.]
MSSRPKFSPLTIPFYPILFAIFPIVSLLGHNIAQVYPGQANRLLWIALGVSALLFAILRWLTRSWAKAALLLSWLLLLWMSYGRIHAAVEGKALFGFIWGRHLVLAPLWVGLGLGGAAWIFWKVKQPASVTPILNVMALALLILPLYQIAQHSLAAQRTRQTMTDLTATNTPTNFTHIPKQLPDIYVIILDTHSRSDVLKAAVGYDNQAFVDALTEMGFYVAPCSMSNYAYTELSLTSMFNLNYLDALSDQFVPANKNDATLLEAMFQNNQVRQQLQAIGYRTVSLVSHQPLAWKDADFYFSTTPESLANITGKSTLNQFERLYLESTAAKILLDKKLLSTTTDAIPENYKFADHVRQQYYILDQIGQIPALPGPKLVLIQVLIPHAPYVFNADGSLIQDPPELPWIKPLPEGQFEPLFANATEYVDRRITPILRQILQQSDTPPIIIVQGDHGGPPLNRLAILNAYYVPEATRAQLYPTISPVNSFRVIFNTVFGSNYELLQDRSYLSDWRDSLYNFKPYPETMPNCLKP